MILKSDHTEELAPALLWKAALGSRRYGYWLGGTIAYLVLLMGFLNWFFPFIETRPGILITDPLLARLPARDVSVWIFPVLYGTLAVTLAYLSTRPRVLLQALVAFALVHSFRICTLYWLPLDAPAGCIPLADPLVRHLAYDGKIITRDLFFSGHTATLCIAWLAVRPRSLKWILGPALLVVMGLLLVQHAHYLIDIVAALIISPAGWLLARRLLRTL
jgi:hypothetical protein